jgi:hypothetical protein
MAKVLQGRKDALADFFSASTAATTRDSAAKSRDAQRLMRVPVRFLPALYSARN